LIKILVYELKRLLLNKFFFTLTVISGLYGYIILSSDIIVGVAYTAPFSPWSYGMYLARVLPLLLITLLFFITFLYSEQEKGVKQLTFATPVNLSRYCLVKCSAIAAGFLLISLFVVLISLVFYARVFRFFGFDAFVIPILITLIPGFLFIFGAGLLTGSVRSNVLYVLMIAVLLLGFFQLPHFFDIYGGNLFGAYPLALPVGTDGEPAFSLPVSFIAGKVFFSLAGIMLAYLGIKRYRNVSGI